MSTRLTLATPRPDRLGNPQHPGRQCRPAGHARQLCPFRLGRPARPAIHGHRARPVVPRVPGHQRHLVQQGRLGLISEQSQYNLLNRYPELEVIPAAEDAGIGLFPYMPLAGGLLTGQKKAAEGSRTRAVELEYGLDLGSDQFAQWSALCKEIGEPEFVVAIAWVLANPVVSSAIVGVRTLRHLEGLERAAELKFDADVMARLDVIFDINRQRPLKMGPAPEVFAW